MGFLARSMRRGFLRSAAVIASMMAALLASSAADAASPSPSPIPQGCQLVSPQPEAPLKLNLVAVKSLVKTIVMEKEVFNCYDAQSTLAQVKDVQTFIELTGRALLGERGCIRRLERMVPP